VVALISASSGIDTFRISRANLENYIKEAQNRPLFLHLGRKTIRAPRLVKIKEPGKSGEGVGIEGLPPADVPCWHSFKNNEGLLLLDLKQPQLKL
jgi:hypothetical protein